MPRSTWPGSSGQEVDAERLGGQLADPAISCGSSSRIVDAPSVPMPPASLTAATSGGN
jgi:hypothetical protein